MKKTFLTLISALYATTALSATPTCEQMPTCEDLGYADADSVQNCKRTIGCPFDATKVACIKDNIIPTRGYCKIGDVFYSDLTCGNVDDYYDDGVHIPVGVVFMLTDEAGNVDSTQTTSRHGRIISLDNLKSVTYSETRYIQILSVCFLNADVNAYLLAADGQESTSAFFSGKADTLAIIEALPDEETAAKVAYEYYPSESLKDDPYVGQYQWYLPSAGELVYMLSTPRPTFSGAKALGDSFPTRDLVESVLQKLGKSTILRQFLSTTEGCDNYKVWYPTTISSVNSIYGQGNPFWHYNTKVYVNVSVRPILAF